jgi:magnesium-transporting ATPase (P-type)
VRTVQEAGIRIRMITGDHASTASAIAKEIGLRGDRAITGAELEAATDEELQSIVRDHDVYARTSPEHKLRLVRALQANGEVVAMTGDGVNDAPSLKQADVGVAMGNKGTEATKDAADVVLADDNFATISAAVKMGRTIYDNLRKAIVFMLPTNGGQGLVIFVAMLVGMTLPITPLQVLWVNLITAVTLSLALSFEPAEPGIMKRRPRDPEDALLDSEAILRILFVSVLLGGATIAVFQYLQMNGSSLEVSRTIAVNTLVVGQVFYLFTARFSRVSALRKELFTANPVSWLSVGIMLVLQIAFCYLPFMQDAFETTGVGWFGWAVPVVVGIIVFLAVETDKLIRRLN